MSGFTFVLRRTLPLWSFRENLEELEQAVVQWKLDEVMVKVDTEELSHGQVSMEWLDRMFPRLEELGQMLARHGTRYDINPWITLCHLDRGRHGKDSLPGFEGMVDISGSVSEACACPLSPAWLKHTKAVWKRYASLHPYSIWIEDDMRHFNHSPNVSYGCFCPRHLERFAKAAGLKRKVTREELVAALSAKGEPHPWRRIWLETLGQVTVDVVRALTQAVHEVDPNIQMGLMTSGPRVHETEGRDWQGLAKALSDNGRLPFRTRPTLGMYTEALGTSLYMAADLIRLSRHVLLPARSCELTEVEDFPYSRQSCSVSLTRARLLVSAATGCQGAAMNLFDHLGTPMEEEAAYSRMIKRTKKYLDVLADTVQRNGHDRGVAVPYISGYAKRHPLQEGDSIPNAFMPPGGGLAQLLGEMGLPTIYSDSAPVNLMDGTIADMLSDEDLERLLKRSLWLDGRAADVLCKRGLASLIGLEEIGEFRHPEEYPSAAAEEFLPRITDHAPVCSGVFVPSYGPNAPVAFLKPVPKALPFSRMIDNEGNELGLMSFCFRNERGGRIFVHGYDYARCATDSGFLAVRRRQALRNMLEYLDPPVECGVRVSVDGAHPMAFRRDLADGRVLMGAINLSADSWTYVDFRASDLHDYTVCLQLTETGEWQRADYSLDSRNRVLRAVAKVKPLHGLFLLLATHRT